MPKKFFVVAAQCVALFTAIGAGMPAAAQSTASPTAITAIRTGWLVDAYAVETAGQAILNPANCPAPDAYMMDSTQPGYKTSYATLLAAFSTGKTVEVVVHNTVCTQDRPLIIGTRVH